MDKSKMMNIEDLVTWVIDLEGKYYDLQSKYQTLIHQYEELKLNHENCSGHRDQSGTRYDPFVRNQKP